METAWAASSSTSCRNPRSSTRRGRRWPAALPKLGFEGITAVRQGKRFELEVDGEVTEERLAQIRNAAETLLSNPVIEEFTVRVRRAR